MKIGEAQMKETLVKLLNKRISCLAGPTMRNRASKTERKSYKKRQLAKVKQGTDWVEHFLMQLDKGVRLINCSSTKEERRKK